MMRDGPYRRAGVFGSVCVLVRFDTAIHVGSIATFGTGCALRVYILPRTSFGSQQDPSHHPQWSPVLSLSPAPSARRTNSHAKDCYWIAACVSLR